MSQEEDFDAFNEIRDIDSNKKKRNKDIMHLEENDITNADAKDKTSSAFSKNNTKKNVSEGLNGKDINSDYLSMSFNFKYIILYLTGIIINKKTSYQKIEIELKIKQKKEDHNNYFFEIQNLSNNIFRFLDELLYEIKYILSFKEIKEINDIEILIMNHLCLGFESLLDISKSFDDIKNKFKNHKIKINNRNNNGNNISNKKKIFIIKRVIKKFKVIKVKKNKGRQKLIDKENIENKNNNENVHTNEEKCNATKTIIHACKKQTHDFILAFTEIKTKTKTKDFKLFVPTIKTDIINKDEIIETDIINKEEIIKFIKKKLFDVYIDTVPKRVEGDEILRDIKDKKERKKKKIELLSEYRNSIIAKKEEEEKLEQKRITAVLDLTFLDFLKIFLEYGYENNNLTIKIDEQKYGFSEIKLENFKTYSEMRNEFSKDEEKQKDYRQYLKDIIEEAQKNK